MWIMKGNMILPDTLEQRRQVPRPEDSIYLIRKFYRKQRSYLQLGNNDPHCKQYTLWRNELLLLD
jgi:hypothetical protein